MANPIMQKLNRSNNQSSLNDLVQIAKGNPDAVFNSLMQSNPQFARFINANKGKTPEQIARENGIDLLSIMNKF